MYANYKAEKFNGVFEELKGSQHGDSAESKEHKAGGCDAEWDNVG